MAYRILFQVRYYRGFVMALGDYSGRKIRIQSTEGKFVCKYLSITSWLLLHGWLMIAYGNQMNRPLILKLINLFLSWVMCLQFLKFLKFKYQESFGHVIIYIDVWFSESIWQFVACIRSHFSYKYGVAQVVCDVIHNELLIIII